MRGEFLHNEVLVRPLERAFRRAGAITSTEFTVWLGNTIGYIDLIAMYGERRFAVEAERSTHRIEGDLRKANALRVDELWIVVPTESVGESVRRTCRKLRHVFDMGRLFVLTQGQALQRVTDCLPLIAGA